MLGHLGADRRTIADWEQEFGFTVVKPTGWAKRGLSPDIPLTADAFILMSLDSIISIQNYQRMIDTGAIDLPKPGENNE